MKTHEMDDLGHRAAADLEALRQVSARDLPTMGRTAQAGRALERRGEEGYRMSIRQRISGRSRLATGVGLAGLAVVMLGIPVSFERTIGFDVRLDLPAGSGSIPIEKIAAGLQEVLHADNLSCSVNSNGGPVTLDAHVPVGACRHVESVARGFAGALAQSGLHAVASVRPLTARVSTSVYAWAAGSLQEIRINRDGKSDAEVAEEIRARLRDAGFGNPSASVTTQGRATTIKLSGESQLGGGNPSQATVTVEGRAPKSSGK